MEDLESHATEIVAAYVSNNHVALADLPGLIAIVRTALSELANAQSAAPGNPAKATEAKTRASITPDFLISFLDGRPYKTLKRHLSSHGLDPDSYRVRFGLPSNYPMVAATYSTRRSEISRGSQHWKRKRS